MKVEQVMLSLIGEVVLGHQMESLDDVVWEELLPSLYKLSGIHDMSHIIAEALDRRGLLNGEYGIKFQKRRMLAVFRYQQLQYELDSVAEAFEQAKIPFMPLKGSVLRAAYPEGWMRTSCDIDILVRREDLDAAIDLLVQTRQYRMEKSGLCDVSLYAPSEVHLELHHDLVLESRARDAAKLLSRVWEYSAPVAPGSYRYAMCDEVFYLYHIAHMAKHFEIGGSGVRPILDLWIMDAAADQDRTERRNALLREAKLMAFTDGARRLSRVWFEGAEHDDITSDMNDYVLRSGIYGCIENRVAAGQVKTGGKIQYIFSRLFLPLERMRVYYPTLQRHAWLLPFYYVKRALRLLSKGRAKRSLAELRRIPNDPLTQAKRLLSRLELIK